MKDRDTIQKFYIRMCRDSGFRLSADTAAKLTAMAFNCHPLEVWLAMPSLSVMDEIAAGTHPAVQ